MRAAVLSLGILSSTLASAIPFESPPNSPLFIVALGCLDGKHPLKTLVDTGAVVRFGVLLSPAVARDDGLAWSVAPEKITNGTVGSAVAIHRAVIGRFDLGPLSTGSAGVTPGVATAGAGGRFDAVVGYEFLRSTSLTVDYRRRNVEFGKVSLGGGVPFALAPRRPLMLVSMLVNKNPMTLAFDTAAASILISPSAAARAGLRASRPVTISGAGGTETAAATTATIEAPGVSRRTLMVAVSTAVDRAGAEAGTKLDGVIGPAAMRLGTLAIDYPHRRIWLNPHLPVRKGSTAPRCG